MKDTAISLINTVVAGIAGGAARIASQYQPGTTFDVLHIVCGLLVAGFTAIMAESILCSFMQPSDNLLTFVDGMSGFAASSILRVLTDMALALIGGTRE